MEITDVKSRGLAVLPTASILETGILCGSRPHLELLLGAATKGGAELKVAGEAGQRLGWSAWKEAVLGGDAAWVQLLTLHGVAPSPVVVERAVASNAPASTLVPLLAGAHSQGAVVTALSEEASQLCNPQRHELHPPAREQRRPPLRRRSSPRLRRWRCAERYLGHVLPEETCHQYLDPGGQESTNAEE